MYPSVINNFVPFNVKVGEGYLPYCYADQENFVTCGMGNKVDPVGDALVLPWRAYLPDGPWISADEIRRQWQAVKDAGAAGSGGGNQAHLTTMRLDDDGIKILIAGKLANNEAILSRRIPQWATLPPDAQLGIHSMAWAMGPEFNYPKFLAAINAVVPDWDTAVIQCWMPDNDIHAPNDQYPSKNFGLRPRNLANQQLFRNAAQAVAMGTPGQLLWNAASSAVSAIGVGVSTIARRSPAKTALMFGSGAIAASGLSWWLVDSKGMKRTLKKIVKT